VKIKEKINPDVTIYPLDIFGSQGCHLEDIQGIYGMHTIDGATMVGNI
jgi:hypothetical protein